MTREEAQRLLDATTLRPQDVDEEARALADADPALKQWLEERKAFDERMANALDESPVPMRLQNDLLRAMQAEATKPRWSFRMPSLFGDWRMLAAVAAVAILSLPAVWLFKAFNPKSGDWQGEALAKVMLIQKGMMPLEHHAPHIAELKPLLASAGSVAPGQLPGSMLLAKTFGCRVIQVAGKPATVICFDIGSGEEAHLLVMNVGRAKDLPSQSQPLLASRDGWHTASWTDGSHHYMLVTTAGSDKLKKLLA
jgi:anti-sigma factor RsiW